MTSPLLGAAVIEGRSSQASRCSSAACKVFVAALLVMAMTFRHAFGAGLLVADGGLGGVLEIQEHAVRVTINNGIAVTEVTQVFRNTENRQVEALYTFPVPKGASVANFSMWINGKEMIGEVLEKNRAREIYNSYKQVRRDPGLLEQKDYRTFEMRIFPIAPNALQKVQISYYQELESDGEWVTYVYPLATAVSRASNEKVSGRFALSFEARSEVPIIETESPSHPDEFVVAKHTKSYVQASMEATGGDLGRDLVLAYRLSRPRTGIDLITSKNADEDGYFYLTLTAGEELAPHKAGMDYVFVLDVSGSMEQQGKLRVSRESIDAFVKALGAEDRFEIITFNITPRPLFSRLAGVTDGTRSEGAQFLASQVARGGTVLNPAITAAYRYSDPDRTLNVVLLSDGMTEQGQRAELLALIGSRPSNARVFCIGVGNDVDRPLLEQMAHDSGGLASFLSRGDDFQRQAQAFRRKLLRPAASNLELAIEGIQVYDVEPKTLPNLYHGAPVKLYGRYREGGDARVKVRGDLGSSELRQSAAVSFPRRESENPEIERMWALHKVERLLKEADRTGSRETVVGEIVRLGEAYSIVTEYTSFLVLENDNEYQRWKIERRNALRIERDRKKQQQLNSQLEAMRRKASESLGPAQQAAKDAPAPPAPARDSRPAPVGPGSSGRGGGALDPVTGGIALGLASLALAVRGKKKSAS